MMLHDASLLIMGISLGVLFVTLVTKRPLQWTDAVTALVIVCGVMVSLGF